MKKHTWLFALGAVLVLVGLALVFIPRGAAGSLESVSSAPAPWPPEVTHLKERLAALSLPALTAEGTALHIHQHLDIFVHGKAVEVPPGIGIHETFPSFISTIHVHDTTGIVHVESPTIQTFNLGQFFDIWGVRFTNTCLGSYCTDETNTLRVYVNGAPYTGDLRALPLAPHDELVITYGTSAEEPSPIPASYTFPQGY